MYYKTESYIGSEYAGKELYEAGLTPVYVSDNPILNAQHVLFEAAKAYHYGLPYHAALASVTTAPANELGMGQRLGKVKPGYDADVVVWDSDPLSVGATPVQVWVDGAQQYTAPVMLDKPISGPIGPDESLNETRGEPEQVAELLFTGVTKAVFINQAHESSSGAFNVVISGGNITCVGECKAEFAAASTAKTINLKNGYLTRSFTAAAGTVGLNDIDAEDSTDNGANPEKFTRAIDGLHLDGKKLKAAAKYGVTRAISAPKHNDGGTHHGTSVGFLTSARNSLQPGAVFASDAAVHYTLSDAAHDEKSYSQAFGDLRKKLLDANKTESAEPFSESSYLKSVLSGDKTLALTINSADGIASALRIKSDVQDALGVTVKMAIIGGAESHLVAHELAAASVGVILTPLQTHAKTWDKRRTLSGAPLTNGTEADWLVTAGVTVAIGLPEDWYVRDLGFEAGRAYRNGNGRFTEESALAMVSDNVYKVLRVPVPEDNGHFIVSEGSPLEIGSKIRAVGGGLGRVSVWA